MAQPGWYADPGGEPGHYRYWDGHGWSSQVSAAPGPPPPSGPGLGGGPRRPRRKRAGWWLGGAAVLAVFAVIVVLAVRAQITGDGPLGHRGTSTTPRELCPAVSTTPPPPGKGGVAAGRVRGGDLSYPLLPGPWSTPAPDVRVPFGRDVWTQSIVTQAGLQPGLDWYAGVIVAQLQAGDGFYTPRQGSDIVVTCIVGSFYFDAKVTRRDTVNRATTVQGKDAWLVESQLSFAIPGLRTRGELLIVLIVATGEGTASLFYASVPDDARQWEEPARRAMDDLRVES